jgi:hypothetical protein
VPAAPDLDDDEERARARASVDESPSVRFLDLPDLDADHVIDAIVREFSRLDDDAVLTAYCTIIDAAAMADRCELHGLALVHCVPHHAGITFVLRRSFR